MKIKIFVLILSVLAIFSAISIFVLMNQSLSNLDRSRELSEKTIRTTIKEQTTNLYKSYSQNLAKRISDFLISCENNLHVFSLLPNNPDLYISFSKNNLRWVNAYNELRPLYKELALIDRNGQEIIKIIDNKLVPQKLLKNISYPENTTYLSETYFDDTKKSASDIFISHLSSWYISQHEQLEQGKTLNGLFRFCKKLQSPSGEFIGICMLALDAIHILDFVDYQIIPKDSLINKYKKGSYTYLIDDDGWIIAHQKLWDIKGYDHDGRLVEPLSEATPNWKYDAGILPINLLKMDWRLKDFETSEPMSSVIERVRRGETTITTMKSMGIHSQVAGIARTRAYAPIFYSKGAFSKYGIFGIVSVGTSIDKFNDNAQVLATQLSEINDKSKERMIYISLFTAVAVFIFSFIIARWITNPMNKLTLSLTNISKGNYNVNQINSPIEEVKVLSKGVIDLANELKLKESKINLYVKDLELVNEKLAKAKKELATYWHHEYEAESATILEEKIKLYESEYPVLKVLRKEVCIGNSLAFLRMLRLVVPQSQMNIPTWICGESGVGKSSIAYVIHVLSPRSNEPFHVFGASEFAAADPMIVMGKLFGYGQGHGITGIDKNGQPGILAQCDGGTLLIDDVDALPLDTQSQILRVVEGLDFHHAAGKPTSISVDVRFLFASSIDLEQKVKEGLFRKDFYRRIGGSFNKIEIPPLRSRNQDIPLLAAFFLERFCKKHNIQLSISDEAMNFLLNHQYEEGNIAELKVLIEIACENAKIEKEKYITLKHFPPIPNSINSNTDLLNTSIFNASEVQKLSILRKNYFRINTSEELAGFKTHSHTLSHYLRGMALKALINTNLNLELAAQIIAGSENDGITFSIVKKRIDGYLKNIIDKTNSANTSSLYKNLPKEYHNYLESALYKLNEKRLI